MKNIHAKLTVACLAVVLMPSVGSAAPPVEQIYDTYCVQCHGLKRNGTGVNLPGLSTRPRDHTDTKAMGDTPDDEIFKAIKEGGLSVNKSALMPPWGNILTDPQITELVQYLRTVCHCAK